MTTAINCVNTWFLKNRGFAVGVSAAGSSLGGKGPYVLSIDQKL